MGTSANRIQKYRIVASGETIEIWQQSFVWFHLLLSTILLSQFSGALVFKKMNEQNYYWIQVVKYRYFIDII